MDTYGWIAILLGLIIYFLSRSKKNGWHDLGIGLFFGGIGWNAAIYILVANMRALIK